MSCSILTEHNQCCCNCKYHLPIFFHCITEPKPENYQKGKCCCSVQKGWACVSPISEKIYDNWPEHSIGCEEYRPKNVVDINLIAKDVHQQLASQFNQDDFLVTVKGSDEILIIKFENFTIDNLPKVPNNIKINVVNSKGKVIPCCVEEVL